MKIGLKLGLSYAGIMLALIVVIVLSLNGLSDLNNGVNTVANDRVPKMIWANQLINNADEGARALRNALLSEDPAEKKKQIDRTLQTSVDSKVLYDSLNARVISKDGKVIMDKINSIRPKYYEERKILIAFIESNNKVEAVNQLFTNFRAVQTDLFDGIKDLIALLTTQTIEEGKAAEESYQSIKITLFVISGIAILLVVFLSIYITRSITKPLNQAVEAANSISDGNINVNLETNAKDETGILLNAMKKMAKSLSVLIEDTKMLTTAAEAGKLDTRADGSKHKGAFKDIIVGVNGTLDSVIGPLNVAAEYVDRISKGDIPPKITDEYKGDFNEIKNNLNQCIDAVDSLVADANKLAKAAIDGKLDTRADATKHLGEFRAIVQGVNNTLDSVIGPLNVAAEYVDRISKGDIPPKITDEYKGDFNEIKNNLNQCIDAVDSLVADANKLAKAAIDGKLDTRADATKHLGEFRAIVQGVNNTLDSVIGPLNVAAEYVDRISKGDIPPKITDEYKGDFNEIKNNLNQCIDAIDSLVADANNLAKAAVDGKLDTRADATKHLGDFRVIVQGVNNTLDSVIGPLNVAAEYVDRISKGDIPPKITDEYKGDFNEIKNNINQLIDNVSMILHGIDRIVISVSDGNLKDKGNDSLFTGDWRKLVQGINHIIDELVAPINLMANFISEVANGEQLNSINDDFKGDFNIIKNNINTCIKVLYNILGDTSMLAEAAVAGKLDVRADLSKYSNAWNVLVKGVNDTLDAVIGPLNVAAEYVDRVSKGDIPPKISDVYNGDFNEIKNNLNQCIDAINLLVSDSNLLSKAAISGKLDIRADATKHQGDFRRIVQGVNETLDSVVGPLNVAAEYIDRISKGDMPQKIVQEYNGDFNEIKINLNQCIDAVKLLIVDSSNLAESAVNGDLANRADAVKHNGDFQKIIQGVNQTLDAITDPMNEAGNVLSILATGDLTALMNGEYKGDYQILKDNINTLVDSLNDLIKQITESVDHVADASLEISSTAETMAAASEEQSSQADEVAGAVEVMSRTITENAMAAQRTAQEAEKNGIVAKEGGYVVAQTVNKMKDIAVVVKQSAENIEKLGESSKQIGEIISVIDDIADQTNLLALNAAIEAARAGEQGRGFAVVADEVRKLAERTTEATKQIAIMIKGIQNETQEAVVAMKRGNEEVTSGIALADKAGQALNQILESTQDVQMQISKIAAASEEQSSTSEEIAKNVNSISHVTNDSAKRIQDIAKSSEELSKLTDNLKDLVNKFKVDDDVQVFGSRGAQLHGIQHNKQKHLPSRT